MPSGRVECKLNVGIGPVCQDGATQDGDIVIGGVGHIVVTFISSHPRICARWKDGVGVSSRIVQLGAGEAEKAYEDREQTQ